MSTSIWHFIHSSFNLNRGCLHQFGTLYILYSFRSFLAQQAVPENAKTLPSVCAEKIHKHIIYLDLYVIDLYLYQSFRTKSWVDPTLCKNITQMNIIRWIFWVLRANIVKISPKNTAFAIRIRIQIIFEEDQAMGRPPFVWKYDQNLMYGFSSCVNRQKTNVCDNNSLAHPFWRKGPRYLLSLATHIIFKSIIMFNTLNLITV